MPVCYFHTHEDHNTELKKFGVRRTLEDVPREGQLFFTTGDKTGGWQVLAVEVEVPTDPDEINDRYHILVGRVPLREAWMDEIYACWAEATGN